MTDRRILDAARELIAVARSDLVDRAAVALSTYSEARLDYIRAIAEIHVDAEELGFVDEDGEVDLDLDYRGIPAGRSQSLFNEVIAAATSVRRSRDAIKEEDQ